LNGKDVGNQQELLLHLCLYQLSQMLCEHFVQKLRLYDQVLQLQNLKSLAIRRHLNRTLQ